MVTHALTHIQKSSSKLLLTYNCLEFLYGEW